MDSRSRDDNVSIGVGFGVGGKHRGMSQLAASQNNVNGESVTYQNSHVVDHRLCPRCGSPKQPAHVAADGRQDRSGTCGRWLAQRV